MGSYDFDHVHNHFPLMWPMVLYHKIDKHSPLYRLDPTKLSETKLEIIVKVTGVRTGTAEQFSVTLLTSTRRYSGEDIFVLIQFCSQLRMIRGNLLTLLAP